MLINIIMCYFFVCLLILKYTLLCHYYQLTMHLLTVNYAFLQLLDLKREQCLIKANKSFIMHLLMINNDVQFLE